MKYYVYLHTALAFNILRSKGTNIFCSELYVSKSKTSVLPYLAHIKDTVCMYST